MPDDVEVTLHARLRAGLIENTSYLLDALPPEHDQIAALTRQVDALIRIALTMFDSTVGT
jgi:hypothetical protein